MNYFIATECPFAPGRGYLTEVTGFGAPAWNTDPNEALSFKTKEEAEAYIARHNLSGEVVALSIRWNTDPNGALAFKTKEEVEAYIARHNLRDAQPIWVED